MTYTRTVLVVDDDQSIVELMRDFLENEGFRVEVALNVEEALGIMEKATIDCVLLDIMMPGQSGFDLCRRIRRTSEVPILFLSARGDDVDKIRGLGLGGDDYIVKSASPAEVVARVKAVFRRYIVQETVREAILDFGRLVLDVKAREVRVDGHPISVTPKEFELLCLFVEHPRQVFTYEQLLERFWDGVGDKHTVSVHIGRIREKVGTDSDTLCHIVNVWGVGYRFEGTRQ